MFGLCAGCCDLFLDFFYALVVTNFSFVSSELNIPFATNVGALTVTRCETATRYVVLYTKIVTLFNVHLPA